MFYVQCTKTFFFFLRSGKIRAKGNKGGKNMKQRWEDGVNEGRVLILTSDGHRGDSFYD